MLEKKKIYNLIIFSLIILNVKNFERINSEINRNDIYKFNNFPFYNKIEIIIDEQKVEKSKFFHIEIIRQIWRQSIVVTVVGLLI